VKTLLASAAIAAAVLAPGLASAGTEYFDFSGPGQFGPISGQFVLDVVDGVAVSGTGFITAPKIGGTQTLTLITPTTPGSSGYPSGIGWRDGSGTDTWGWDNVAPIDEVGGLDFSFGAGTNPPQRGQGWQFGIWNNDGPSGYGDNYQAWMSGPNGYWGATGALTVAAPEPATWAMIAFGFAGLGLAGYRKGRVARSLVG
jgi:hypothetical protein